MSRIVLSRIFQRANSVRSSAQAPGKSAVLILDEPTVGLDPKQIIEIRAYKEARQDRNIFKPHTPLEIQAVCDKIVIINRVGS